MRDEVKSGAHVVVRPGAVNEQKVEVFDRLFIGRECSGVEELHRLIVDDPNASRNHLEIRVQTDGSAFVVDSSTNGTRLNGVRIERAIPVALTSGDRLMVGALEIEFRSESCPIVPRPTPQETIREITHAEFVMVVADIVSFSTISRAAPSTIVMESMDALLAEFRNLVSQYRGTLSNYVGDAFFAVWELDAIPETPTLALEFVMAAAQHMTDVAPTLALRSADGEPLRMGWGVSCGDAAVSSMTGALLGVVGDAANLAFRLSGIAARQGRSDVLVAQTLCKRVAGSFPFEALEWVEVKGREQLEPVHGLRLPPSPVSSQ
jgi:class 3 adenylate cyclase